MLLTKEQILTAEDLPFEDVSVPEWGGEVRVRTMTGAAKDAFEESVLLNGKPNYGNFRAKLLSKTIVDDGGNLQFTEAEVEALGGKSSKAIDRVYKVAKRLNAISSEDQEELVKN